MKKLLIISPPVPPNHLGGDGKFALDIALELSKRKLSTTLFSPSYNEPFEDKTLNNYLRSIRVPIENKASKDGWDFPIWEPKFTKRRDSIFLEYLNKFDLINKDVWIHEIGGSIYNSLLIELNKEKGLQYSCHVQFVLANYDKLIPNNRLYKELTLNAQMEYIKCSKLPFFLSERDAKHFKLKDYSIIPNGVDLKRYRKSKSKIEGNFKIFIGGRLYSKMKGTEKIFTVLSKLLLKAKRLEIHICAPDKSYFDLFDRGVLSRVIYHGWTSVEKTQKIIQDCHISLVPSIYEPFGLLALESLANGVAVLATKTGGLAEMIKPGVNGEFIDLSNPNNIEGLITSFASSNKTVKKYDSSAIRESIEKYDISNIGDLYIKNLKKFIGNS